MRMQPAARHDDDDDDIIIIEGPLQDLPANIVPADELPRRPIFAPVPRQRRDSGSSDDDNMEPFLGPFRRHQRHVVEPEQAPAEKRFGRIGRRKSGKKTENEIRRAFDEFGTINEIRMFKVQGYAEV